MDERVAVITGARRGLGFETARELAKRGYRVVLTARDGSQAEEAAQRVGHGCVGRALDVGSDESVAAFFEWLQSTVGRIDVLVNNAGTIFESGAASKWDTTSGLLVPAEVVAQAFNNNTLGAFRMLQRALPMMNAAGYGRVVNVSSGMGGITEMGKGFPAYRLSKAALNATTRVFHADAAANVKINSVCPGWVRTEMGGPRATRSVEEGAAGIVWAATLPDDGPSGGFFRDGKAIAW